MCLVFIKAFSSLSSRLPAFFFFLWLQSIVYYEAIVYEAELAFLFQDYKLGRWLIQQGASYLQYLWNMFVSLRMSRNNNSQVKSSQTIILINHQKMICQYSTIPPLQQAHTVHPSSCFVSALFRYSFRYNRNAFDSNHYHLLSYI